METNVTFNSQKFMELDIPQLNSSDISRNQLPDLKLNKTYYKLIGAKQLQAFRILAVALKSFGDNNYLIQLPNQSPQWILNYIKRNDVIFEQNTDFLEYMQGNTRLNINIADNWYSAVNYVCHLKEFDLCTKLFYHSWLMYKETQQPVLTNTLVDYFLILEDKVEICLKHNSKEHFSSKEECLSYYLNGFTIDDFAEEVEEIRIKVLPNKQIKKKLQVIELELDF